MPTASVPSPFGRRVAAHRARIGLTQQDVADRLALSRNAVSHIETGDSIPTERTIVLLAGLFGIEPHELVAGTDYPDAKADRLPLVAARHTAVDARLLALDAELRWVSMLSTEARREACRVIDTELLGLERRSLDPGEHQAVRAARARVRACSAGASEALPGVVEEVAQGVVEVDGGLPAGGRPQLRRVAP